MRFAIVANAAQVAERAFFELKGVLKAKPDAVIGFATGATPLALYAKMVKDHKENGTSYKRVTAINLDEYVGVDAKDKSSFARYMRDNLFSQIDINPANTYIPNGMAENLSEECARYSEIVRKHPADVQILGIGANGHIGFNEPYTKYDEPTHIAHLTAKTRADNATAFKNPALVPFYALTMGINEILTAKKIILIACGENKAEALYNMLRAREDTSCPAAALRKHPDVLVVADKEAASKLDFLANNDGEVELVAPAPVQQQASAPAKSEEKAAEPVNAEPAKEESVKEAESAPVETAPEEPAEEPVEEETEPAEEEKTDVAEPETVPLEAEPIEGCITEEEEIDPYEGDDPNVRLATPEEIAEDAEYVPESDVVYEAEAYEKSDVMTVENIEETYGSKKYSRSRKNKNK